MSNAERAVIAGLQLHWRQLGDDPDTAFGLWVLDDPDAMLDSLTQEEFDRTDGTNESPLAVVENVHDDAPVVIVGVLLAQEEFLVVRSGRPRQLDDDRPPIVFELAHGN